MDAGPGDCTVEELARRRAGGAAPLVLDVRTEEEYDLARLEPSMHLPMHEVPERLAELESHRAAEIVVMCHHGRRSAMVCGFLRARGFDRVRNLVGGIDAWSSTVDASVPRY